MTCQHVETPLPGSPNLIVCAHCGMRLNPPRQPAAPARPKPDRAWEALKDIARAQ